MKLKIAFFSIVILSALFLSAFGSPAPSVKYQDTVVPDITVVAPTVVVEVTGVIPVTGDNDAPGLWTLILFGLLGLLGIAFLVALFSPRTVVHEHPTTPPHDHDHDHPV